jgi:hypothetical protein
MGGTPMPRDSSDPKVKKIRFTWYRGEIREIS